MNGPRPSDAELVARVKARDRDGFAALVARYQAAVVGAALAITRDAALAEDLAQEVFVAAWRDLGRLRDAGRVGPYLVAAARNHARSAVRRRARRAAAGERGAPPPPEPAPTPHDEAVGRERRALLRACLDQVPEAHREALVLFYLEGQSVEEVARVTGASAALVKQRLSRGRRALRSGVAERIGSLVEAARPGRAFTAGVVAAASAAGAGEAAAASAAGKVLCGMTMKKGAVALVGLAAVVTGGVVWIGARGAGEAAPPPAPGAGRAAAAGQGAAAAAPRGAAGGDGAAAIGARRLPDRAAHRELLARVRAAQARRLSGAAGGAAATGSPATPSPALPGGDLDKDYVRESVREIIPLIEECYTLALERVPDLAGRVAVTFTIEGEPEVGGVIGSSQIEEKETTMADPAFLECVQETMYAVEIDPPSDGGVVTVTYPFEFRPGGEDG